MNEEIRRQSSEDMSSPKIVATIECRMNSTRLPGKVMLESCGKPMLQHIAERLSRVKKIDEIVFATTTNADDDCIVTLSKRLGVSCFRGAENDVLKRVLLGPERLPPVSLLGHLPSIFGLVSRRSFHRSHLSTSIPLSEYILRSARLLVSECPSCRPR